MGTPAAVSVADLELPPREQIASVLADLCPDCAQDFLRELMDALWRSKERSKEHPDLRPVQEVVEAWYASLVFLKAYDPAHQHALLRRRAGEKPMSFEEVQATLGT